MTLKDRTLAFIGGGHITEIIISNLSKSDRVVPQRMFVSDPVPEKSRRLNRTYGVSVAADNIAAVSAGDFIFINVLPQQVAEVVAELESGGLPENKVIITVAAGIPIKTYEALGPAVPVVRALPNPPSQVGMGIAALSFNVHVTEAFKTDIFELFSSLGEYVVVKEEQVNTVMALSSPTITYMLFQSIVDAGVRAGIDRTAATKIVYQTIAGAMEVWKIRQAPPTELISEASTPAEFPLKACIRWKPTPLRPVLWMPSTAPSIGPTN